MESRPLSHYAVGVRTADVFNQVLFDQEVGDRVALKAVVEPGPGLKSVGMVVFYRRLEIVDVVLAEGQVVAPYIGRVVGRTRHVVAFDGEIVGVDRHIVRRRVRGTDRRDRVALDEAARRVVEAGRVAGPYRSKCHPGHSC